MRVAVPGWDDPKRSLEFGGELARLEMAENYEFDFQNVSFVTPGWLLVVGGALRAFRNARTESKRRVLNFKHLGYAAHVGFFKYFGMSYGLAPSEAGGSSTYVPITETNVADIKEEAFRGSLHPGQIIEDHAGQLARLLTRQADGTVVDTLTYSIREIVRNVVEHSNSPSYAFAAQYWPAQNSAELAVADSGCGILSSLKENPKLQVESDLDALKLAMLPGISSKAWRGSRSQDAWVNSGYGLFMTQKLCSLDGQFTLLSGRSGLRTNEGKILELQSDVPGTIVVLKINAGAVDDLQKRLSAFHDEGRELAKKVGGANRLGPSLASQVLKPTDGH
jgi:hypothetical protein